MKECVEETPRGLFSGALKVVLEPQDVVQTVGTLEELVEAVENWAPVDIEQHYTFREYSRRAHSTVMYPESGTGSLVALNYTVLAAVGEAGEIANKLKKVWRGDKPLTPELKAAMADEIGDVLWYLDRAMVELGYPEGLEAAAKMNNVKLEDRRSRKTTQGDGDNR